MVPEYAIHPAASLFPLMSESDLAELANDIKEHGLRDEIILLDNMVLDGRNRFAACKLAEVEPRFCPAGDIGSPTLYVISKNLHRRHLSTSQRAAIAAEMIPMLREEAKKRQANSGPGCYGGKPLVTNLREAVQGRSAVLAGAAVGVGASSVERATKVKRIAPELFEKVKVGETTVNKARDLATGTSKATRKDTNAEYTASTDGQRVRCEAKKRKMIEGLSLVRGICGGLEGLDCGMVRAVCTEDEISSWASVARELAKSLRDFADKFGGQQ